MNLPITFKVPPNRIVDIGEWVNKKKEDNTISYFWPYKEISFIDKELAIIFSMTFGIHQSFTLCEQKLKEYYD